MKYHTLYLCYFGLNEPLVQTQVLPYLRELKKLGYLRISLVTFEAHPEKNWPSQQVESRKNQLAEEGIEWSFLKYHKEPSVPATFYDVLQGVYLIWKLLRKEKIDILHARVHVPAVICALARKISFQKPKILFDIRGFLPEEYTDAGVWKEDGWLYKTVKRIEKWIFKESDGFIVLTEKAREILFPESINTGLDKFGRPVEVIPCCVSLDRFDNGEILREEVRHKLNIENRFVLIYIGSFGGWYLTNEMLDFFEFARKRNPATFTLILTQREGQKIADKLVARGFPNEDFLVKSVSPDDIPQYLFASDVAVFFIKPCYSKLSSSPTKVAEFLAGGIPLISNDGVGDILQLVEEDDVGVIVKKFSEESYLDAIEKIEHLIKTVDISNRCKTTAFNKFDLPTVGGTRYRRLYEKLLQINS